MGICYSTKTREDRDEMKKSLPNPIMTFDKNEKMKINKCEPRISENIKKKENTIRENSNNEKKELIELELFFSIYDIIDIAGKLKI